MHQPENKHLLGLLVKAYNCALTDYYYFPDVIYAGTCKMERADFDYLLQQGLLIISKFDSFGRYYTLSKKGDHLLQQLRNKSMKKKIPAVPLTQGCFYFSRVRNPHNTGARCLLFL